MILQAFVKLVEIEIEKGRQAGLDWRDEIFSKAVMELEPRLRPAPNGLTSAYIEIAARLNEENSLERLEGAGGSTFFAFLDMSLQAEISQSILNEIQLLDRQAE